MQYQKLVEFLTYDQISLVPVHVSTLEHRSEADTSVRFGSILLRVPILASPMPDVCDRNMAIKLSWMGASGIIHRFQSIEDQTIWTSASLHSGGAVGISEDYMKRTQALIDAEFGYVCLDTANGASVRVQEAVGRLKDKWPHLFVVVGNVATAEAFRQVQDWGADAIRVGIAGGSVCETRTETGIYSPMATAVYACNLAKDKALLIADGGIKTPADMCKALALGADVVMMGGALAGTKEAPGQVFKVDGKLYKLLRGAASFSVQKESKGDEPEYVEGTETLVPYRGSVEKVINRFAAGLRSSMSYADARTLEEYRSNIRVVRVGI